MKKLVFASGLGLGLALLLLPGGCALSLAVAGGAISAATTDPACLSEETSDRSSCAPNFAGESPWVLFLVFYEGTGWCPRLL